MVEEVTKKLLLLINVNKCLNFYFNFLSCLKIECEHKSSQKAFMKIDVQCFNYFQVTFVNFLPFTKFNVNSFPFENQNSIILKI